MMLRREVRSPVKHHEMRHVHPELPISECLQCRKEASICRSKRRFPTADAAAAKAQNKNIATGWVLMLTAYGCPWCEEYHITKAKPGTKRWKRVERRRRRWLTEQEVARRGRADAHPD